MKYTNKLILPLTLSFLLMTTGQTFAKELSLSVYPSKIFIRQSLPIKENTAIKVTNSSNEEEIVSIEKKIFKSDRYGKIKFTNPDTQSLKTLSENFHVLSNGEQVDNIKIQPNQTITINIRLNLSKSNNNNDLLSGILLRTKSVPEDKLPSNGISARSKISIGIFLPIVISPTNSSPQIRIDHFSTNIINTSSTPSLSFTLKNPTKHAISTNSEIIIRGIFGREITKINITNKILTSGSKYNYQIDKKGGIKLLAGVYKAELSVNSLTHKNIDSKIAYIVILQLKEISILGAIILILLLIMIRVRIKRKFNQ